jgi:hypothetical protein
MYLYIGTLIKDGIQQMAHTIDLQDNTFRRLFTIRDEITHFKKKDITMDDVINELIDTYQENSWTHFGAGAGGG